MELELGPQRQFSKKMTDRERRKALDRIIQNHYPNKTPEEIQQIREEYIAAHYGKERNFLPQPEKNRIFRKAPLSMPEIAEELTRKHITDMKKPNNLGCLLALINLILGGVWLIFGLLFLVAGSLPMKLVALLTLGFNVGMHLIRKKKRRSILYPAIGDSGLVSRIWTVEDTQWEYVQDYDDGSYYSYSLCLTREDGEKLIYAVSAEEYSRIREGDSVYLLYFNKERMDGILKSFDFEKPVYLVEANCWRFDQPLKDLLGISDEENNAPANKEKAPLPQREIPTAPDGSGFTWIQKAFLIGSLCFVLFVMLFGTIDRYHTDVERANTTASVETTRSTVPEEDRISIPEPEHFFGVEELVFEKLPEEALQAYYDLMAEKYGFVLKYPDFPLGHSNFLTYGETDTYDISVLLFRAPNDGLIRIEFWTDDHHRPEKLETWDGDITPYLYDPSHWEECSTCSGTGRCQECWGTGEVDTGGGYDINRERCQDCDGKGKCPNCYGGQHLTPKSWDEMTNDE